MTPIRESPMSALSLSPKERTMASDLRLSGQVAELAPLVMATMGTHAVQLYEDDAFLIEILARVAREGVEGGDGIAICVTTRHRAALERRLDDGGIPLAALRDQERFVEIDIHEVLAACMVGERIDEARFADAVGRPLDRVAKATRGGRIRVFGEMVAVLWGEGRRDAALEVERLWNVEVSRRPKLSALVIDTLT